jgi:hypothetical protein
VSVQIHGRGEGRSLAAVGVSVVLKSAAEDTEGRWTLYEYTAPARFAGPPPHWHKETDEAACPVELMSVISRANQVTLPVAGLREAGLKPGDEVRVYVLGPGKLALVRTTDLVAEFAGIFDATVYPADYLEWLRREW